jgi:tetratricopeptide (TPR) repeat protein
MDILYTKDEILLKVEELKDYIKSDDLEKLDEALVVFSKYGLLPELRDTIINYIEKKFVNTGNYEAAYLEYQKALAIFPEDDEIFEKFVNIAEILVSKDTKLVSKSDYRVIIKSYIKLLSLIGKFNKALTLISNLVSQNPEDVEILLLSAEVYETEGQIDKAVSTYLQIINKLPKDQQIKIREQISIIDPANKDNVLNLVELYISNKDYQSASKILRNYLRYNQNDLDIISRIAEVDMLIGNYRSALVASKKALDADPKNPKYKYVYAVVNYYNKTNLAQVESLLDQILPELVNMKLLRESQEAFKILSEINDSYHYKYFELVNSLEKEFKEKEVKVFKEEEKVEIEAALDSAEYQLEKEIKTQKTQELQNLNETQSKIEGDQLDFEKDKKNIDNSQLSDNLIENKSEQKLKDTEGFLEKRETFTSLKRRSTGVYIKKDIGEPKTGEKKLLIKEFTEKKELEQGIKKGFLPKGDQNISENQLKRPLLKDSDKPILESKPILKLEKPKESKDLIKQTEETTLSKQLTKQEIGKIEGNLENTLEQLDILSSTSTINIQQKLTEQKIAEKLTEDKIADKISDKIQEIEIKIETTDKSNVNIEVEIFENAISEIIRNLHKSDLVVFTMLKMVDNIYELSKDRLKLAFWITRILNIAELLKLTKIKQKLIKILEELNYYKIASYINYSLNTKNTYTYLFEILLENEFENIKNNIKEYFRVLINEKLYFTFNEFYNKLINKFKNEKDQIDDIIIDLFKETTEETDFIVYFINENPTLKSKLPKELLIILVNSNEMELKDEEYIDTLIYLINQGNFEELFKLIFRIKDIDNFILNFIKSVNGNNEINEIYNAIKNEVSKLIEFINDTEKQKQLLILLAYLSFYDNKNDLLDLSLLFNEIFKKVINEKIPNFQEFIKILSIIYINTLYLPLNVLFLINYITLNDNSFLFKKENILKIYIMDVFLVLKRYKEDNDDENIKVKLTELEDLLANQEEIDNQALILGLIAYINYYLYKITQVENYKEESIKIIEKIEIILDDVGQKLIYFFYLVLRKLIIDDDKVSLLLEKENISLSDLFFVNF